MEAKLSTHFLPFPFWQLLGRKQSTDRLYTASSRASVSRRYTRII